MYEIITIADVKEFTEVDIDNFLLLLSDAQEIDLKQLLGHQLYIDICENPDDYTNVLDPYTWTYNAKKYSHRGLKCVLANFVATRQHQSSASVSTPFGEMLPNSEFSTRAPEKEIARKAALTQSKALSYWEDVKLFLIHNSTTYPLFDQCETNESQSIRVTAIGGGYSSLSKHNKYNW